ncbi:acidic partial [Plasmopara halstedii]|uniref:Acidic partial n=1 Tax=Plasmopara halstedii TaxID=4781 RepID=A0A0P1AEK3_PLAHL|nr:acidic partial [Plasmopara halstedii]CEG39084.1 acidic partial [Plasmopara halstedii]
MVKRFLTFVALSNCIGKEIVLLRKDQHTIMVLFNIIISISLLGATPATSNEILPQIKSDVTITDSSIARFFDESRFQKAFPHAIDLYNFDGLINACKKFPAFANSGNDVNDKRELAAFLAQTSYESDKFQAAEEYARDSYTEWQYCDNTTYPCSPGRHYHGRGPLQLSWNYNYLLAGKALDLDLLNNPDLVATDTTVTWMTALWFWMTPPSNYVVHDVVAGMDGFALSTKYINGGLECGVNAPNRANELHRIDHYNKMCELMDVQPLGKTACNDL